MKRAFVGLMLAGLCAVANAGVIMTTGTTTGKTISLTDSPSTLGPEYRKCFSTDGNGNKMPLECDWLYVNRSVVANSIGDEDVVNGSVRVIQSKSIGYKQVEAQDPDFKFAPNKVIMVGFFDKKAKTAMVVWMLLPEFEKTQYYLNKYGE